MSIIKRRKHRDQSEDESITSPRQLFADYPYPILDELEKATKPKQSSNHTHNLVSLQWYKEHFHNVFSTLHSLHHYKTPTSFIEGSFRQAHIDSNSSKAMVNNLQKKTKPMRIKRILPSSRTPVLNDQDKQTNESRTQRINISKLRHHINDDFG